MVDPDANDRMVSHNYTLWNKISLREIRWESSNGSTAIFGKLKRTFCA